MRFFKTAIITYVILSACIISWEVFHYSFVRQNFDGFGPGLLAFALMCFVFPFVSIVIAVMVSSKKPTEVTPIKLDDPDQRNE